MPSEKNNLYALVDPVSPPSSAAGAISAAAGFGGGAGHCPRVRKVYCEVRLSPYPACAGNVEYRGERRGKKSAEACILDLRDAPSEHGRAGRKPE